MFLKLAAPLGEPAGTTPLAPPQPQPLAATAEQAGFAASVRALLTSFQLVAATNPCPCGHLGNPRRTCTCSQLRIESYRARLSGPLLDRIDLHVHVPAMAYRDLASREPGESSASVRARVEAAHTRQRARARAQRHAAHARAGRGGATRRRGRPLARTGGGTAGAVGAGHRLRAAGGADHRRPGKRGVTLAYSSVDKEPHVSPGDVVENKRLGAVLSDDPAVQSKRDEARLASPKMTVVQKDRLRARRRRLKEGPATVSQSTRITLASVDPNGPVPAFLDRFAAEQAEKHAGTAFPVTSGSASGSSLPLPHALVRPKRREALVVHVQTARTGHLYLARKRTSLLSLDTIGPRRRSRLSVLTALRPPTGVVYQIFYCDIQLAAEVDVHGRVRRGLLQG